MRCVQLLALGAVAWLGAGCAGYRLGPVNRETAGAGQQSIQVTPFANRTLRPLLADAVTQALRERLAADGTYRLASHGAPDIIVSGVILGYQREGLSYLPNDALTVGNYRVTLTARVTARERLTGRVLLDQKVKGYTLVRVGTDLASAERQATPLLAGDLSRRITELLTEGSW